MDFLYRRFTPQTYGWIVVGASCLMMGLSFGSLISITVFLKPLEAEFGWERGVTSFAYSSASFMTGLLGIGMGRLVDRVSPRPIALFGALILGTGQLLLSRVEALWQLYLIYGLLVGGLGNASFLVPLVANVSFWFERHKGLAIGAVMAGQSLGGALMPNVARLLLEHYAWRDAYVALGLLNYCALIPLALIVRNPPGLAALKALPQTGGARATAIAPGRLTVALCMAIVCCCICMAMPVVHLYPLTVEAGFSTAQAALLVAVMMSVSIIGRVGIGTVADKVGGIRALLLASGVQTALIFWFTQAGTLPGLLVIAALFGLGYGGVIPAYAMIIRELMPPLRIGQSIGIVLFFGNLGMSLGGYLGGLLYDLSGGYPLAYATGALGGLVNLTIVGTLLFTTRARRSAAPVPA